MKIRFLLLFLCIFIFTSCATVSQSSEVQVFFIEKGKLQYFFPPSEWLYPDVRIEFEGDWLYRTFPLEGEEQNRTVFNFSLRYDKLKTGRKQLSGIVLVTPEGKEYSCRNPEILFTNHEEDRYTSWITSAEFAEFMLGSGTPQIRLVMDGEPKVLQPLEEFKSHQHYFKQVRPDI